MNNKPELEIFADDVQCAPWRDRAASSTRTCCSTCMARGLPKAEAESLLVQAFLGEALEFVENEAARDAVAIVESWLKARS